MNSIKQIILSVIILGLYIFMGYNHVDYQKKEQGSPVSHYVEVDSAKSFEQKTDTILSSDSTSIEKVIFYTPKTKTVFEYKHKTQYSIFYWVTMIGGAMSCFFIGIMAIILGYAGFFSNDTKLKIKSVVESKKAGGSIFKMVVGTIFGVISTIVIVYILFLYTLPIQVVLYIISACLSIFIVIATIKLYYDVEKLEKSDDVI